MRKRTHYIEDYTRKDGEHIELELEFEPYGDVTVVEKDDKVIVGYLVLDPNCTNPLEDCDGIGAIHHHPKSWYGRHESKYYDILGLDSYGDPIEDACPNPDAVLLDLYDHGPCQLSVSGRGMNCRWDTSRGEAVWVPDKYLQEELAKIEDPDARYAQAVIYAEQAVELYNAWSSGDCYGVVVQTHDKEGAMEDEDAVWGYLGGKHAEEELASCMEYRAGEVAA